jgi:hypothetical protein
MMGQSYSIAGIGSSHTRKSKNDAKGQTLVPAIMSGLASTGPAVRLVTFVKRIVV